MYYILNETHQIIAADEELLTYCAVAHIDELSISIAKGDMYFERNSDEELTLSLENSKETFLMTETILSSMLGQITLINISPKNISPEIDESIEDEDISLEDTPSEYIHSILNDENVSLTSNDDITISNEEDSALKIDDTPLQAEDEITFGDHLKDDEDIITLKDVAEEESSKIDIEDTDKNNQNDSIDFILPEESEQEESDNDITILDKETEELSEIIIDSEALGQKIGISSDDYKKFLDEFIDTALKYEKDLQSDDDAKRSEAISTLSHLIEVLHLPIIADIVYRIEDDDNAKQVKEIESFYSTLSRFKTIEDGINFESQTPLSETTLSEEKIELFDEPDIETPIQEESLLIEDEEKIELFDELDTKASMQETSVKNKPSTNSSFGSISLEGIKPIHFDFQLEEAANDLSLPVELIEEFVHDFIEQSHTETKKMLEAYEDGDLDMIQKIGHLLKGASSNLRINPLADTLYKIQFCENSKDLETLIKDYWAYFLSFENQINTISR